MSEQKCCACSSAPAIVFSCSGAADVGALADGAARMMSSEGRGRMACLAAVGAGLKGFIEAAGSASVILAIDGCRTDCARLILENAGIEGIRHARITDMGFSKGSSPVTPESISTVFEHCNRLLESESAKGQAK